MSRMIEPWIGRTDDADIPARVKIRVFDRFGGACAICRRELRGKLLPPHFDHVVALINGGAHAESNLQPLCRECHAVKTVDDVKEKARVYRKKAVNLGLKHKARRLQSRGFEHRPPQCNASRPINKWRPEIHESNGD